MQLLSFENPALPVGVSLADDMPAPRMLTSLSLDKLPLQVLHIRLHRGCFLFSRLFCPSNSLICFLFSSTYKLSIKRALLTWV